MKCGSQRSSMYSNYLIVGSYVFVKYLRRNLVDKSFLLYEQSSFLSIILVRYFCWSCSSWNWWWARRCCRVRRDDAEGIGHVLPVGMHWVVRWLLFVSYPALSRAAGHDLMLIDLICPMLGILTGHSASPKLEVKDKFFLPDRGSLKVQFWCLQMAADAGWVKVMLLVLVFVCTAQLSVASSSTGLMVQGKHVRGGSMRFEVLVN